ncbi:MAG: DnaJ domain-containing protein [Candidatus Sericytochromatia bacterium]
MNLNDFIKNDYYQILGVTQFASEEEINKAYRTKAKEVHPDKFEVGSPDYLLAEAQFKQLQVIKEILLDKQKRHEYDMKLMEEQQLYISYMANSFNIQNNKEEPKEEKKSFKEILKSKMEGNVIKPQDTFTFSAEYNSKQNSDEEDFLSKEEKAKKYKKEGAKRLYDLGYQAMRYGDHQRARTYFKSAKYLDPSLRIPYQYYS